MKKFIVVALLASMLTGCIEVEYVEDIEGTGGVYTSVGENAEAVEDIADQVDVKWETTSDRDVCVFLTNNLSDVIPFVEGKILYKDSTGETLDVAEFYFNSVLGGSTVVHCAYAWDVSDAWESYEITYSLSMDRDLEDENHAEKCVISSNEGDENVIVEIKNNAGVKLDEIEYVVVFYKNDEVVYAGYPEDRYEISLESGATYTGKVETRGNEYDRYEVYLNEALAW